MERFIDTFFKPSVIVSTWPKIVDGMLITVELAIVVVLSGLAFGLLLALLRTAQVRVVNALIIVFVDVLRALPPLVNRTIAITKNTALGTVIGVPELLNQATTAVSFLSNATPLTLAAFGYLIIFVPVVLFGSWLERRYAFRKA